MAHSILPYEVITSKIIERLEQGTVPWHQPWSVEMPKNLVSKRKYRGINVFLLGSMGYANPWWLTFRQAKQFDGHVRRGEKATPVVFWKVHQRDTGEVDEGRPAHHQGVAGPSLLQHLQCGAVRRDPKGEDSST